MQVGSVVAALAMRAWECKSAAATRAGSGISNETKRKNRAQRGAHRAKSCAMEAGETSLHIRKHALKADEEQGGKQGGLKGGGSCNMSRCAWRLREAADMQVAVNVV